jgi:hypothetical protein
MATGSFCTLGEVSSRHTIAVELQVRDMFITLNIDMKFVWKIIAVELRVDENLFGHGSILTS